MTVGLMGTSGSAAIPTTALDPPHRAASLAVPALSGPGPHRNGRLRSAHNSGRRGITVGYPLELS